jgi:hypothetical protein
VWYLHTKATRSSLQSTIQYRLFSDGFSSEGKTQPVRLQGSSIPPKHSVISFLNTANGPVILHLHPDISKDDILDIYPYKVTMPTTKGGAAPKCRGCKKDLKSDQPRIMVRH